MSILNTALKAQINLLSQDIENELDLKSLDFGYLIKKGETISDFSYKFLSDCREGYARPYIDEKQKEIWEKTKLSDDLKLRVFSTSFGLPNAYYWEHDGKSFEYTIDSYFHRMSKIADSPTQGKALYMVVMPTLLNGKFYVETLTLLEYLRPLYIGSTNNLHRRWSNHHHRRDGLNFLSKLDIELTLQMYFIYEDITKQELHKMENTLIRELSPVMNRSPVLRKKKKNVSNSSLENEF